MAGFVEHVRVDAERCPWTRVPEDATDLHDVEPKVNDQVARERVMEVVEPQRQRAVT